ncbi:hypothetical protein JB92DRAFT_3094001 [Gautieria morchelliformis]|nr:hypothetical protein JB92DRAFT_3094001 [Gautieria morchelliformis]
MSTARSSFPPVPTLEFQLKSPSVWPKFSPRLGQLSVTRPGHDTPENRGGKVELLTPGLMASTTRGVIPHLTRDNVRRTPCVKWVHVPFESFLQVDPPIPTLQKSSYPLHTFLGFPPAQHLVSLSLRDPADGREMPPNGKLFAAAHSSRGARKVTCPAYRSYITATRPDIVFSMSDIPFNSPPHSQKRISKSIERSAQWLMSIFTPPNAPLVTEFQDRPTAGLASESISLAIQRLNVFVHMVGGIQPAARSAFAAALLEPLEPKEKQLVQLATLDEGVSGYVFDLVPIRVALVAERAETTASTRHPYHPSLSEVNGTVTESLASLIRASLQDLPVTKLRLVNTAYSPHEMLRLIRDAGVDLFDTYWAQQAANWGVALDFRFPVAPDQGRKQAATEQPKKYQVGHNLYEQQFAHDFTRLTDSLLDDLEYSKRQNDSAAASLHSGKSELAICSCAACSPTWSNDPLLHSTSDDTGIELGKRESASPYTRAYIHHLLHTHEMSAHALLVMHNLTVMDAFMCEVRAVLQRDHDLNSHSGSHGQGMATGSNALPGANGATFFATEVARFEQMYDDGLQVLAEAKVCWAEVDLARGKGRLARERAKASGA